MAATPPSHAPDPVADALRAVDAEFPGWHAWLSVTGRLLYARRPRTSPPVVVWSRTVTGLRLKIAVEQCRIDKQLSGT